jgi:mRNA interferase RelE/StbE
MAVIYTLFIEADVHAARDKLPGHVRQRMRRAIDGLVQEPRPAGSRPLATSTLDIPPEVEVRRLRIERWRLVYAVHDQAGWIWILGLHRRPPYDYEDLPASMQKLRSEDG